MRIFTKIILAISLINTSSVLALNFNSNIQVSNEIKKANLNADIGIKIKNLQTNKVLYQQNEDRYYNFASSLKIITIFSLLKYFGSDYFFTNQLLKSDQDYYLNIDDPEFSTKDLKFLINKLKETGVTTINGNFYIVNNQFTVPDVAEGRMIEDGNYCYGAPVNKVSINKNCIKLSAIPSTELKKLIYIENKEMVPLKVINTAYTVPERDSPKIKTFIEKDKLVISGTLNRGTQKINIGVVVRNSSKYLEDMIREVLANYHINFKGQILYSNLPKNVNLIASTYKSFEDIGSIALKKSDNFITDYLLAEFGTRFSAEDWKDCGKLLKQFVFQHLNVNLMQSTIVDGSGLSRYNMLTVNQFDEFLSVIYKLPEFGELLSMLARPGEEGTLKERFKGIRIFAKTGSMTGISSIVGYVFDANNVPYSLVIVFNNYLGPRQIIIELQEAIIKSIVQK